MCARVEMCGRRFAVELLAAEDAELVGVTAAMASGLPSKPTTTTLPLRPAALRAATAPRAMVSLPAKTPRRSRFLCRMVSILVNASCWSQLALSLATSFMSGYWEMTSVKPLDRTPALVSDSLPTNST
jgi:hypothetical protein